MWKLVLFVALLCCGSEVSGISCKNQKDQDVDWFILYKLPGSFGYYYIDPVIANVPKPKPAFYKDIKDQNGVLAKTLEPYFSLKPGAKDVGYIAYNDQPPTCNALDDYGHSKGLVMMDGTSGFWLLHSTPRFPYKRESNSFYPDSGETNGQTFICVTFDYATFKDIGEHLLDINIYSFDHYLPAGVYDELRKAADVFRVPKTTTGTVIRDLKSKDGKDFTRIVQDQKRVLEKHEDLYVAIAEKIGTVFAQTWQGKELDDTGVEDVLCISVDEKSYWGPGSDHSKWCVSEEKDVTCFADLNRNQKRRGGALCIENNGVKTLFRSFIKDESYCKK